MPQGSPTRRATSLGHLGICRRRPSIAPSAPIKTRLIEFGRHAAAKRKRQGLDKPIVVRKRHEIRLGAKLLALMWFATAEGRAKWTLRLLEDKVVETEHL